LKAIKRKVIKDWLFFAQDFNLWTDPKSKHWNGDKANPEYGRYFPKYDLPKEMALSKFYDEYYIIGARAEYKFPGYIRNFASDKLKTEEGQREILRFVGYKEEDMVLNLPENKEETQCQQTQIRHPLLWKHRL